MTNQAETKQDECRHYEHFVSAENRYICPDRDLCPQCSSNARWNDTGGYKQTAEECRQYCRNAHK